MTRLWFRLNLVMIGLTSLMLRLLVPPNPLYGAVHDDELMVRMARNILDGEWVGDYQKYGHIILSKPAGYPLFLAYTHWMPWAPTVTIHSMILIAFLGIMRELRLRGASRRTVLTLFLISAFFPAFFNEQMSRIYRDGLLTALTTLIVWLAMMLYRKITESHESVITLKQQIVNTCIPSISLGLCVGYFVITKPSWHFILAFLVLLLGHLILPIKQKFKSKNEILLTGLPLVLVFISVLLFPLFVMSKNQNSYGVFKIDTFSTGNFNEALKAMYGVKDFQNRPYVDITKEMRSEMYRVSPTMKKLQPFLENPDIHGWRGQVCKTVLKVCDESANFFPWELRDAIEKAGLGATAKDFETNLGKITSDLRTACRSSKIQCESEGLAPGLDSLDSLSFRNIADAMGNAINFLSSGDLGIGERGEVIGLPRETISLWDHTIKQLPPRTFATQYESNNLFLLDIRKSLSKIYSSIWIPILIISTFGLLVKSGEMHISVSSQLRIIGLASLIAVLVFALELSLLEASSAFYMTNGGSTYLQPLFPLMLLIVFAGITRISLVYQKN